MSNTKRKPKHGTAKKMKTLQQLAGRSTSWKEQPDDHGGNHYGSRSTVVARTDGTVGKDKTIHAESRPGHKQTARNANRAAQKQGRTILKRQLIAQVEEIIYE
jgi:hypothetical protein